MSGRASIVSVSDVSASTSKEYASLVTRARDVRISVPELIRQTADYYRRVRGIPRQADQRLDQTRKGKPGQ
jgi:hypothetical protein